MAVSQCPALLHITEDTLASYPVSHVTEANDPTEAFADVLIVPWDILGKDPQPLNKQIRLNQWADSI